MQIMKNIRSRTQSGVHIRDIRYLSPSVREIDKYLRERRPGGRTIPARRNSFVLLCHSRVCILYKYVCACEICRLKCRAIGDNGFRRLCLCSVCF